MRLGYFSVLSMSQWCDCCNCLDVRTKHNSKKQIQTIQKTNTHYFKKQTTTNSLVTTHNFKKQTQTIQEKTRTQF